MQTVAIIIVTASGLWLMAVSFLMALRPRYGVPLFVKMTWSLAASNWRLQLTEPGLRILGGAARIGRQGRPLITGDSDLRGLGSYERVAMDHRASLPGYLLKARGIRAA